MLLLINDLLVLTISPILRMELKSREKIGQKKIVMYEFIVGAVLIILVAVISFGPLYLLAMRFIK